MPNQKRAQWTERDLSQALEAIRNGTSISQAAQQYSIPRTTLGLHKRKGNPRKRLGRKSILTFEQERDLVSRIHRLAEVGLPVTSKIVRKCVFSYAAKLHTTNPFSGSSGLAGRKWLKLFFGRHPDVAIRKAQHMNPGRAQKMNPFIVSDYFSKLKNVMSKFELFDKPENIYNMDEKGCRLTIHKQQNVLAKKGAKRIHLTAPEHGENVSIVACGNALGQAIPPCILFKGQRLKHEWGDHLPPGSNILMTAKGSMTTEAFTSWLTHFSKYKNPGRTLLIFDGAKSHLDISIVEAAEDHGITLFCLPSNTTHELQPMDKAVFRSFETFWDQEVLDLLITQPGKPLTKMRFGEIFSKVWLKSMTPSNIISGFRATGIFPFYPDVIPESAFAPSLITHTEQPRIENNDSGIPGTSGLDKKNIKRRPHSEMENSSSDSDRDDMPSVNEISVADTTDDEDEPLIRLVQRSKKEEQSEKNKDVETPENTDLSSSFKDLGYFLTPEIKVSTNRRPALNSRAQEVTKDLFSKESEAKAKEAKLKAPKVQKIKPVSKKSSKCSESWFCFICGEDRQADMRLCSFCNRYVHEECVGLSKEDKDIFKCPACDFSP